MVRNPFLGWLVMILAVCSVGSAASADLTKVKVQFVAYLTSVTGGGAERVEIQSHNAGAPDPALAERYVAELRDDGSWADIDYRGKDRSAWQPYMHALRMTSIAAALADPRLPASKCSEYVRACVSASRFWRQHDFICPNWWFNEIGVPMLMGEFAILLGDDLPPEEKSYYVGKVLARSGLRLTGQNRVWMAGNVIMRSVLADDEPMARQAAAAIWDELKASTGEGIQPDGSFHQHGPQQQFGNYGLGFAVEIGRWMTVLRDTSLAVPPERAEVFRKFMLDGHAWVAWRGEMDISACGRQLMPNSPRSKVNTLKAVFANMATVDRDQAVAYEGYLRRNEPGATNDLVGDKVYWRSDYAVSRGEEIFASVKMSSARVIGGEKVNNENLAGRYLADGALLVYRQGDEYENIFPVWDWRHIPGTTELWEPTTPVTGTGPDRLMTNWSGGASDGQSSALVEDYLRDYVRLHKAWFTRRDAVVALGNNVFGYGGQIPVHTTINQCLRRGPITFVFKDGHRTEYSGPVESLSDVVAVEHDGLRYQLLFPTPIDLSAEERSGNWSTVFQSAATPKETVRKAVFNFWINHGALPQGGAYGWMVTPLDRPVPAPTVVVNEPGIQALRWNEHEAAAAFWKATTVELFPGRKLSASAPCVVQFKQAGEGWKVTVADPSQKMSTLTLDFDGKRRDIVLPEGPLAGSSTTFDW